MAYDAHANFATSLVETAPSPATSGTALDVTTGQGGRFPAVPFNAVVCPVNASPTSANAEIVRVTARTTNALTITRAQEGSSARTIVVGDRIYAGPTAKSLTDIESGNFAVPTGMAAWTGTSTEGSATTFSRSDHAHGIPFSTDSAFVYSAAQYAAAPVSTATGATNTYYAVPVTILAPTTLTGVEFRNGATMNGNVRSALYNALGVRVADRTTDLAQAGTANANRKVPFTATYDATPGSYYALIWFSSATATAFMAFVLGTRATTGTNATTTPTSPGTLAVGITAPVLNAY